MSANSSELSWDWKSFDERYADVSSLIPGSRTVPEGSLVGCHSCVFEIADHGLSPAPSLLRCVILEESLNFRSAALLFK